MSSLFQGYSNSDGRIRLVSSPVVPSYHRGMNVTATAVRYALADATDYPLFPWEGPQDFSSFRASLISSLVPQLATGSGTPTFTRATVAYQTDFENKYNAVLSGEARFQGARRVQNFAPTNVATWNTKSASMTVTAGVLDPLGGTSAYTLTATAVTQFNAHVLSFAAGTTLLNSMWVRSRNVTGAIRMYNGADTNAFTAITPTTTWQRLTPLSSIAAGAGGNSVGIQIANNGDSVDVWQGQMEPVTGQANQNPSEYVSVGVLSAPFHGANVDAVKYFGTMNGNTVTANVVTEATGGAIKSGVSGVIAQAPVDAAGPYGYLSETASTQIITTAEIRDMTTANWTLGATMTRAKTSVGADGVANSATRLTGGAVVGTNTITFLVTAAASSRTYSCLMRRVTGTGTVWLTQLAATQDITAQLVAGQWVLVQFTSSQLNATIGVQINVAGDAVDVDFNQFEAEEFATSRMGTTGASRNGETLTYLSSGNMDFTQGSAYAELSTPYADLAIGRDFFAVSATVSGRMLFGQTSGLATSIKGYDGTTVNTKASLPSTFTGVRSRASTWGGSTMLITGAGAVPASSAFDGTMGSGAVIEIGASSAAAQWGGTIRNVRVGIQVLNSTQLRSLSGILSYLIEGLIFSSDGALMLSATNSVAGNAPGGVAVDQLGYACYFDGTPDVFHQGVGLKNDGRLAVLRS